MRNPFKSRITLVIAGAVTIGMVGAGGAVAHGMIGTDDIRNRAVTKTKIKHNAVNPYQLAPDAVRKNHVRSNQIGFIELKSNVNDKIDRVNNLNQRLQRHNDRINGLNQRVSDLEAEPECVVDRGYARADAGGGMVYYRIPWPTAVGEGAGDHNIEYHRWNGGAWEEGNGGADALYLHHPDSDDFSVQNGHWVDYQLEDGSFWRADVSTDEVGCNLTVTFQETSDVVDPPADG